MSSTLRQMFTLSVSCGPIWVALWNGTGGKFQRARQIQGLSEDAHWYFHLNVEAMERMEEKDLPNIPQSFADLVAKL